MKKNKFMLLLLPLAMLGAALCLAQNTLPPLPAPAGVPAPGPSTSAPYAPQPILPGGVVVTLFPAGSPFLKMDRVREAEQYNMNPVAPGRINSIVNIHNPSIEVHTVDRTLNTGAAVILIPHAPLEKILVLSQVALSFTLPFALVPLLILCNRGELMGRFRNGPVISVLGWLTVGLILALNVVLLGLSV